MKVVAILPMKGNSERVPGKNLKEFNGKPLFYHVLETLLDSKLVSNVIINTDSDEIAHLARTFGERVIIHSRPEEICGDFVSMNKIIEYDINKTDSIHFIQTHSTNPLLKSSSIDKAIQFYFDNLENYDSVFSVTRLQTRLYWQDGTPINHNPKELIRTQDLAPIYEENSNFFIFSKESFKNADNKRIGIKPHLFEIDKIEALDIDESQDFQIAEMLHKSRNK